MKSLSVSICMPIFQGSNTVKEAIESILKQTFPHFELIIIDDNFNNHADEISKTKKIIDVFNDKRIHFLKNDQHMGSAETIRKLAHLTTGDIIFYMCQDDILAQSTLQKVHQVFAKYPRVGILTRPFFWFDEDIKKPIRAVTPYDSENDSIISLFDGKEAVKKIFESVGQISGLAYRKKFIIRDFQSNTFTGHIYPFASILRSYDCMFIKDYSVAVRLRTSQTRHISSIYQISPTLSWVTMFKAIFPEKEYKGIRETGIRQIVTHYEGLVQLKNYAQPGILQQEIVILLKLRWKNLFSIRFWLYILITMSIPRTPLRYLTDTFKRYIISQTLPSIHFSEK